MLSFLNVLRGPQSDFIPEREAQGVLLSLGRNANAGLQPLASTSEGASATADPATLEVVFQDLKARLRIADKEASEAKSALNIYERKVSSIRAKVTELRKEKTAAEKSQRRLKKLLRRARREASRREADLQERLGVAETKVEELVADNYHLQSARAQLSTEQMTSSGRIKALKSELAACMAKRPLLKEELQRRDDQVEAEKSKLGETMTLVYLEKEKTKFLEAQVARLKRQLADKDTFYTLEIDALKLASDMYESQEQDEYQARTIAEQERDTMQAERDQALANIASLRKIVDDQGARIAELEEQHLVETLRSDALTVERDRHLEELQNLESALGDANSQCSNAKQTSQQLEKDLQDMQEAYNYLQLILTLANLSDEILQEKMRDAEKDNRELRESKQALEDFMFNKAPECGASDNELLKLCSVSQDVISVPSTPTLAGSGSIPRAHPLGNSLSFNITSQPETTPPKPLRKARSSRKFLTRLVDENADASPRSPELA